MALIQMPGASESDGNPFPSIPKGAYPARVTKCEPHVLGENSKHPGAPAVRIQAKVTPKDEELPSVTVSRIFPLYNEDFDGETNRRNVATWVSFCNALGVEVSDEMDTDDIVEEEFTAVLSKREYPEGSGNMTNDINGWRSPDEED